MNDRTLLWILGGAVGAGILYALTKGGDVINTMFDPDAQQLANAAGTTLALAQAALPSVLAGAREAGINTRDRMAMWICETAHETGGYKYYRELWGPTAQQQRYEGTSLAVTLGNTEPGDGYRFRGRGLIQTTGRRNYQRVKDKYGIDVIANPDLLAVAPGAGLSAALFWVDHDLNSYADARDVEGATKVINGGLTGIENRQALYASAQDSLPSGAA